MINKLKFLLVLAFYFMVPGTRAQWNWQNSLPQGNHLNSVFFTGPYTGFAAGDGGTILKTTDAGLTWSSIYSGTWNRLLCIHFTSASTGFASGTFGTILRTTDGGVTWTLVPSGTSDHLNSMDFTDISTGCIAGENSTSGNAGVILKTTDAGVTWEKVQEGFNLYAISFQTDKKGFATGALGIRCFTSDGGSSWGWSQPEPLILMTSLCFTDSLTGYSAGESSTILKTTDGGNSWNMIREPGWQYPMINSLYFTSMTAGFAVDSDGNILRTMDAGATWTTVSFGSGTGGLRSVFFTDELNGYAVGSFGTILKTTDGGNIWNKISSHVSTFAINSIYFPGQNIGYAAGYFGIVLKTLNGGKTWSKTLTWSSEDLKEVFFTNKDTGYAVGGGIILKTTNGGATWTKTETPVSLLSISFPTPDTGYASGVSVYKTTDAGITWALMPAPGSDLMKSLCFTSGETGYGIMGGHIWKTTDGALTWNKVYSGTPSWPWSMTDLCFPAADTGYAVGVMEGIIKTVDGGATWTLTEGGNRDHDLGAVHFTDTRHGWAVANNLTTMADDRTVLRTSDGGATWTSFSCGTSYPLNAVFFTDVHTGYIAGVTGIILKTTTGGEPLVSPPYRSVPASAGTTTFNVTSDTTWMVTCDAPWCTITPSGAGSGTLEASFTENPSTAFRIANIKVITSKSDSMTVQVSQSGIEAILSITPEKQEVTAPAGNAVFSVTANGPWTAESNAPWCQVSASGTGSGNLAAHYEENATSSPRGAWITVAMTDAPQVVQHVNLVQDKPNSVGPHPPEASCRIEPNPVRGTVRIIAGDWPEEATEISILDKSGRVVCHGIYKSPGPWLIDLSGQPDGCYSVKIKSEDRVVVRKMILLK
jgi:photosystem II stability/assembly factor-like uncharacterized protein